MLRATIAFLLCFTLLLGLAYPFAVTAVAGSLMPEQAGGSLLRDAGGTVIGSELIGQKWEGPEWFQGRPSASGYDATASSGSNYGPTSAALLEQVRERAAAAPGPLPADAATASASGLDPHISPANARLQVARVAAARGLGEARVAALVEAAIEQPALGFVGEARVNVLALNRALDALR